MGMMRAKPVVAGTHDRRARPGMSVFGGSLPLAWRRFVMCFREGNARGTATHLHATNAEAACCGQPRRAAKPCRLAFKSACAWVRRHVGGGRGARRVSLQRPNAFKPSSFTPNTHRCNSRHMAPARIVQPLHVQSKRPSSASQSDGASSNRTPCSPPLRRRRVATLDASSQCATTRFRAKRPSARGARPATRDL